MWKKNKNWTSYITGKELPWHAVRKARELELKYLRDLGVYEKIDGNEAVAQYQVTCGGAHANQITKCCESNSKVTIGQICMQASSIGGVQDHNTNRGKPQRNFLNHAHRRVTCIIPCNGPEACADTITSGGQSGYRRWESGIDEEEHV